MANTFTYDLANLKLGACKVWVDTGSGYAPIGVTTEAQTVSYTPKFSDITANETGNVLLDKYLIGEELKFSMTMLEWTDENYKVMFPYATEFSGTGKSYGFGAPPYGAISEKFIKIKIHPCNQAGTSNEDDETVLDYDYTFWLCANVAATPVTFEKDKPMGAKVEFDVFWDDTKPAGMKLALRGDPANTTLDVTAPTLSSTVGVYADKAGPTYTAVVVGTELTDVLATTRLKFVFSEELDSGSALNFKNYSVTRNDTDTQVDLSGETIAYDSATKTVTITALSLVAEKHYTIGVSGVKDSAGNQMVPDTRRILIAA